VNLTETHDLLTFVAAYDNRRFDDATVLAWQPILADLSFADCRAAVMNHFGLSEAYLMPVHVRRGAVELRNRRRQRREDDDRLALQADPTRRDRSEDVRALIEQLRDSLPDGDPDKLRRPEVLQWERRREREATAEPNPAYDPSSHALLAAGVNHTEETP
jgi:hypothetical protein